MTVLVEFTIPSDAFPLGEAVSGDPNVTVTLEAVVPFEGGRIPFLWAVNSEADGFEQFEERLRNSDAVTRVEALTRIEDSILYHVEWDTERDTFLNGLRDAHGSIVEGGISGVSSFTVRFENHADLTRFHTFYQEHDYPVTIDRVYTLSEESGTGIGFELTPAQRKAVVIALENGYFSVPRETKLEEIADELAISRQAASELVRRGTEKVLRKALLGRSASDYEIPADE